MAEGGSSYKPPETRTLIKSIATREMGADRLDGIKGKLASFALNHVTGKESIAANQVLNNTQPVVRSEQPPTQLSAEHQARVNAAILDKDSTYAEAARQHGQFERQLATASDPEQKKAVQDSYRDKLVQGSIQSTYRNEYGERERVVPVEVARDMAMIENAIFDAEMKRALSEHKIESADQLTESERAKLYSETIKKIDTTMTRIGKNYAFGLFLGGSMSEFFKGKAEAELAPYILAVREQQLKESTDNK